MVSRTKRATNGGDAVLVVVSVAYTGSGAERRGSVVVGWNLVAETGSGDACCIESGVSARRNKTGGECRRNSQALGWWHYCYVWGMIDYQGKTTQSKLYLVKKKRGDAGRMYCRMVRYVPQFGQMLRAGTDLTQP